MKEKKSYTKAQLLAIAVILLGVYLYTRPSIDEPLPGYADLSGNQPLAKRIAGIKIHDFDDSSIAISNQLEEKLPLEEEASKTMTEEKPHQKQQAQSIQDAHEPVKVNTSKETTKESLETKKTVVKEEVIVIPEAGEEKIVSVNTQYIGNSGKVFDTYEEAQAYGQQMMMEYPDTTAGFHVLNSWNHPVNGTTQYTVDLEFIS